MNAAVSNKRYLCMISFASFGGGTAVSQVERAGLAGRHPAAQTLVANDVSS